MNEHAAVDRRTLFGRGALLAGGLAAGLSTPGVANADAAADGAPDDPITVIPVPDQVPVAAEGFAPMADGTRLWYWDTGGPGVPIVLLHLASGSHESWVYQQPVLAKAGYRVIAYSRRGYSRSETGPLDAPSTGADDLQSLVDFLGVDRFHLVGGAAGGVVALDYAVGSPDRLHSLVLSSTIAGPVDEDYATMLRPLTPSGFDDYPVDFRELGGSYRALNRAGVTAWLEIAIRAMVARVSQPRKNTVTWAGLQKFTVPTLLLWGDCDLYTAPPVMRLLREHLPNAEAVIARESGHNVQWERSDVFNTTVLRFLARHSR